MKKIHLQKKERLPIFFNCTTRMITSYYSQKHPTVDVSTVQSLVEESDVTYVKTIYLEQFQTCKTSKSRLTNNPLGLTGNSNDAIHCIVHTLIMFPLQRL